MEQRPKSRGPYTRSAVRPSAALGRPSDALTANVRSYRLLRDLTQDGLAARMNRLSHGWGRSTVSAVEARARNVTVDELFGLALSLGVSIGDLLDPAGPDRSRRLSVDVGLRAPATGSPQPLAPRLAHMWASSQAVLRFGPDADGEIEVQVAGPTPVGADR